MMTEIAEAPVEPSRRAWRVMLMAQVLAMVVCGCYFAWSQRYLYADGSHFFLTLLQTRQVMDFDPSRRFSHYLMEYSTVFLLRELKCQDVGLAGFTFGATLFLVPIAGLIMARWIARKAPTHFWFYPMLSQSILFLNISMIPLDVYITSWIFWCLMYLLLLPERLSPGLSILLIGLSIGATHAYESYLFLAWLLIICAFIRWRSAWKERRYGELATCGVCILLYLVSFYIAFCSTVSPRDQVNRNNFAVSMLLHLIYPPVWFSLLVLACSFWPAPRTDRQHGWQIVRATTIACGVVVALLPFAGFVIPPLQHLSRVQGLYLPILLGSVAIVRYLRRRPADEIPSTQHDRLIRLTALTCAVAVIFQCGVTYQWNRYRNLLLVDLKEHHGVVAYDKFAMASPIYDKLVLDQDYRSEWLSEVSKSPGPSLKGLSLSQFNFAYGWTLPSLSVALSVLNLGKVTTIIEAPAGMQWQPFDPRDPSTIPDLSDYGVTTEIETSENPQ